MAEMSKGYKFNKILEEWQSVSFKPDSKFIITAEKAGGYTVKKLGGDTSMSCGEFNGDSLVCTSDDFLTILGFYELLVFNKKTLRYFTAYSGSWLLAAEDKAEEFDTPFIEIGKCSPL